MVLSGNAVAGAVFLAVLLAPLAAAQSRPGEAGNTILNAAQARAELFGVDMTGFTAVPPLNWRECIAPGGDTLYEIDGQVQRGRMRINDRGQACFAYESDGFASENCFRVSRAPSGKGPAYVFWGGGAHGVFHTSRVQTGVKTCLPSNSRIS